MNRCSIALFFAAWAVCAVSAAAQEGPARVIDGDNTSREVGLHMNGARTTFNPDPYVVIKRPAIVEIAAEQAAVTHGEEPPAQGP